MAIVTVILQLPECQIRHIGGSSWLAWSWLGRLALMLYSSNKLGELSHWQRHDDSATNSVIPVTFIHYYYLPIYCAVYIHAKSCKLVKNCKQTITSIKNIFILYCRNISLVVNQVQAGNKRLCLHWLRTSVKPRPLPVPCIQYRQQCSTLNSHRW